MQLALLDQTRPYKRERAVLRYVADARDIPAPFARVRSYTVPLPAPSTRERVLSGAHVPRPIEFQCRGCSFPVSLSFEMDPIGAACLAEEESAALHRTNSRNENIEGFCGVYLACNLGNIQDRTVVAIYCSTMLLIQ